MSKSIRTLLATAAGITACVLAYYLSGTLLHTLLQWLAGDPTIFQEIYRDLESSFIYLVVRVLVGCYFGILGYRMCVKALDQYGIPGIAAPYSEAVGKKQISVKVFVNGLDQQGQLARLEVFSQKISAAKLVEFYWGHGSHPLVIRGEGGLYLQLIKAAKSSYEAENAGDEVGLTVKVRTRTQLLHRLESVYGQQPTFAVQEGKSIAFYRMPLDYVGSQTDALGMLVCYGEKGLMRSVFFDRPGANSAIGSAVTQSLVHTEFVHSLVDTSADDENTDEHPSAQPAA